MLRFLGCYEKCVRYRYRYSVSYSVRNRQPGIVLWGLKSECILGASVFRFRDRVRDSTLGAKKRWFLKNVGFRVEGLVRVGFRRKSFDFMCLCAL